jgi:hypothetical protein
MFNVATHREDVLAKFHQACTHRLKFFDLLLHNNPSFGQSIRNLFPDDDGTETTIYGHMTTTVITWKAHLG